MSKSNPVHLVHVDGQAYYSAGASGLCRTPAEAEQRARQIAERDRHTETPDGCPSTVELAAAIVALRRSDPRDGGAMIEACIAGIKGAVGGAEAWRAAEAVKWARDSLTGAEAAMLWPTSQQRGEWPHEIGGAS